MTKRAKEPSYTRKNIPLEFRDYSLWPALDWTAFEGDDEKHVTKLSVAISGYLDGKPLNALCREIGVTATQVLRGLNRCLATAGDGNIYGWRALTAGLRISEYNRTQIATSSETGDGLAGAWTQFLHAYPLIEAELRLRILKKKSRTVIHESHQTEYSLVAHLQFLCEKIEVPATAYPICLPDRGRAAVSRWAAKVRKENFASGAKVLGGKKAETMANVGTGQQRKLGASCPYDIAYLDAHRLNFIGAIGIPHPKGPRWIALNRFQWLPVMDDFSRAVLGYSVAIRKEASAHDAQKSIVHAMTEWRPRNLVMPGMIYPAVAGFPSSRTAAAVGAAWAEIWIDNATIHYSRIVSESLRKRTGAAINFGPLGEWNRRSPIENLNNAIERRGFRRLPNTTGTGPSDPHRDDPAGKAVELKMNYEDLLDLIDVVVATYNGEPQSGLGNYSPLQVIQDYVGNDTSMLVRHLPALVAGQPDLHVIVETVTVRGSLENGKRPYVEKDGERYTNALLADSATLLGEKIRIHIDQSDYRSFAAFLPNGQPLGVLRARGAWGTIPHTRDMRISINALIRSGKMVLGPGEEPISGFLRLLGQRALDEKESSKGKQEKISPSATRLARAFVETGAEMPDLVGPLPAVQSDAFLPSSEVAVPDFVQARKHSAKPFGGSRA